MKRIYIASRYFKDYWKLLRNAPLSVPVAMTALRDVGWIVSSGQWYYYCCVHLLLWTVFAWTASKMVQIKFFIPELFWWPLLTYFRSHHRFNSTFGNSNWNISCLTTYPLYFSTEVFCASLLNQLFVVCFATDFTWLRNKAPRTRSFPLLCNVCDLRAQSCGWHSAMYHEEEQPLMLVLVYIAV